MQGWKRGGGQAVEGGARLVGDRAHVEWARALRGAVDVDGAGAAQAGAAAVFGAGQPDMVANGPQQRGRRIGIDRQLPLVQGERNHGSSSRLPPSCTSPLSVVGWDARTP